MFEYMGDRISNAIKNIKGMGRITEENISEKYEGYSYLYEKGEEQVLVNIYKKDNKLVIAYYSASSEYYDIVLDSVDAMLDSLKIKSGVKDN